MDAQERMDRGESADEAHRMASREFGNRPRAAEDVREAWGTASIDRLLQDTRYACRQIRRNPGFVVVAALTKYLRTMLFQVTPLDTATFIAVSILFIAVALLASYIPARQATAIGPLAALRYE